VTDDAVSPPGADSAPQDAVAPLVDRLRAALKVPKADRGPDWEESTSRLVALAAVDYTKQEDESLALQAVALIGLAAARGCKGARKRSVDVLRWRDRQPPMLSTALADAEEAKAALKALAALRTDWVLGYVLANLGSAALADARGELMSWALANSPSLAFLLSALASKAKASGAAGGEALAAVLGILLKDENLSSRPLGDGFLAELTELVRAFSLQPATDAQPPGAAIGDRSVLQGHVLGALDRVTSMHPSRLLEPAAPLLLDAACALSRPLSSANTRATLATARRAIDLLRLTMSVGDGDSRNLAASIARQYAMALARSTEAADERDWLLRLASSASPDSATSSTLASPELALADAIAALLPDWDAFEMGSRDKPQVEQLAGQIGEIARLAGVERFGVPGDVVPYAPLQHHLTKQVEAPPLHVSVVKFGVRLRRRDGSERVILKALAAPHDAAREQAE
jgi:hypothetical protein